MRIVAVKNRWSEFFAIKKLKEAGRLPKDVIFLLEIIQEEKYSVSQWSKLLEDRSFFVDYLRCDVKRYRGHNPELVKLVYQLNNDLELYKEKIMSLSQYENVIPVVALKAGVDNLEPEELDIFLHSLRDIFENRPYAIRAELYEDYENIFRNNLWDIDYFIYDISEQPIKSKFIELQEVAQMRLNASKGVLYANRKRSIKNGAYKDAEITKLIDCSGEKDFNVRYGLDFYGDYGGLKDNLPSSGSNGQGCALALLYDKTENGYWAYLCDDPEKGLRGYNSVIAKVLSKKNQLDPAGNCLAMSEIKTLDRDNRTGSWRNWVVLTLMRTLLQLGD